MKRFLPLLFIVLCAFGVWVSGLHRYLSLEQLRIHHLMLQKWVQEMYLVSLLLYSALYITTAALSIPVSMFLSMLAGFLFGQWVGTVLIVISATMGATLLFLATRYASRKPLKPLGRRFQRLQKGFQESAWSYMITLRLMPMFPFSFVTIAAALLNVSLYTFMLGTLLGIIPGSFVYVCVGHALDSVIDEPTLTIHTLLSPQVVWSLTALGLLSLLPILYRRWRHSRTKSDKIDPPL